MKLSVPLKRNGLRLNLGEIFTNCVAELEDVRGFDDLVLTDLKGNVIDADHPIDYDNNQARCTQGRVIMVFLNLRSTAPAKDLTRRMLKWLRDNDVWLNVSGIDLSYGVQD